MSGSQDSKERLARELWAALRSDELVSRDVSSKRAQRMAADEFEAQERSIDKADAFKVPDKSRAGRPSAVMDGGGATAQAGHQKRDNKRFTYPVLRVMVSNNTYQTIDWSLGGLQVKDYVGELKSNMRLQITFAHSGANPVYYQASVRVIRYDPKKRSLSLKFEKLARGGFDFLSSLQLQQVKRR